MRAPIAQPRLWGACTGPGAVCLEERVRAPLGLACDILQANEVEIIARLPTGDVVGTLACTPARGEVGCRRTRVHVPGAGLDRIDRSVLPTNTWLANASGHESGIAEDVLGAMVPLPRTCTRLDTSLRQGHWESPWAVSTPPPAPWPEVAGKTLGRLDSGRWSSPMAYRAARILELRDGSVVEDAGLVVEHGRIAAIVPAPPAGVPVVDLGARTLLPGLIDCHTPLCLRPEDQVWPPAITFKTQPSRAIESWTSGSRPRATPITRASGTAEAADLLTRSLAPRHHQGEAHRVGRVMAEGPPASWKPLASPRGVRGCWCRNCMGIRGGGDALVD